MLILTGPYAPNHKEPTELTEPEIKRLKETAITFGYGKTEALDRFIILMMIEVPIKAFLACQGKPGQDKQSHGRLQETLCRGSDRQHHGERSRSIFLDIRKC